MKIHYDPRNNPLTDLYTMASYIDLYGMSRSARRMPELSSLLQFSLKKNQIPYPYPAKDQTLEIIPVQLEYAYTLTCISKGCIGTSKLLNSNWFQLNSI